MAIGDPILAFTLSRSAERSAPEAVRAPPREEELAPRPQAGPAAAEIDEIVEIGEGLRETKFDYTAVPGEIVAEISVLAARIKAGRKRHIEAVHDVGAALLRAKELLGHGNFLPWLQAEFRWSERTANNYMSIARFFRGKTANFADLDIGAAAALAAKSTPPEVREELLERAEAGEHISREEVKKRIAAGKRAMREKAIGDTAPGMGIEQPLAPPSAGALPAAGDGYAWTEEAPRPLTRIEAAFAPRDPEARTVVNALLAIESPLERLCAGSKDDVATQLLAAANEQELARLREIIDFVLWIKEALGDDDALHKEPALLSAP